MAVRTYNTNMKRSCYAHMSYIDRSYTSEKQLRKCTRHIVFSQKTSPQIVRGWHDKMNQAPRAFCSFLYCLCVWRGIATLPSFLLIRHHFILADFTKLQTKLLATTDYKKSLFFQRLKCCCLLSTFFFLCTTTMLWILSSLLLYILCVQMPEIWAYKLDTQPVFSDRPKLKLIIVQL